MPARPEKQHLTSSQRTHVRKLVEQVLNGLERWLAAYDKQRGTKLPDDGPFDEGQVDRLVDWLVRAGWVPEAKQLRDHRIQIVHNFIGVLTAIRMSESDRGWLETRLGTLPLVRTKRQRRIHIESVAGKVLSMKSFLRGVQPLLDADRELPPPEQPPVDEIVTLSQVAPLTCLSKRTLERHVQSGDLPKADYPGGGGRAHKWLWKSLRPALEKVSKRPLPSQFPGSRII